MLNTGNNNRLFGVLLAAALVALGVLAFLYYERTKLITEKGAGSFWFGSGGAAVISLLACHVQKFIGAFAFGIDSETL